VKHSELTEVLTRLAVATEENTNAVKALSAKVDGVAENQRTVAEALAQWHSDNESRQAVQDQSIERNRESLKEHGKRIKRLESEPSL